MNIPWLAVISLVILAGIQQGVFGSDTVGNDPSGSGKSVTKQGLFARYAPRYPQPFYYPGYPPYEYYPSYDNGDSSSKKPNLTLMILLLYAFGFFDTTTTTSSTTTTTTVTTASTAFPGTCQWGAWSTCSGPCKGTRSRERMCQGVTKMDSEMCNTEIGFRPDGKWYRASNCYEYFWSTEQVGERVDAEQACDDLGAKLASKGMRDIYVRKEVVTKFAEKDLENIHDTHIGVSDAAVAETYIWSDGHEGDPTFWKNDEPDDTGTSCIFLEKGNIYGLYTEVSCIDTDFSYLCEREAA